MTQTVTLYQQRRCEHQTVFASNTIGLFAFLLSSRTRVVILKTLGTHSMFVAAKYLVRLLVFFGGSKILRL